MRTVSNHISMNWLGARSMDRWYGAINEVDADFPNGAGTVTLLNVAVGSTVWIGTQSGVQISFTTAATSTVDLAIPVYVSGSPLNNLRIKVRKGSASPFYQPWETQTTAFVGSQSIYVSQIPDE